MKFLRVVIDNNIVPAILAVNGTLRDLSFVTKDLTSDFLTNFLENKISFKEDKLPIIKSFEKIGPCISNPSKFLAVGLNFADHAIEQNMPVPKEPLIFSKATTCISGPNDEIILPKNSVKTDWEVEIAFVVGKKAKNLSVDEAHKSIFGYCLVCDVSERDFQKNRGGQFIKGKSADSFGPIGPYLVTKDEITNVYDLNMTLDVNKKRMQTGNTKEMIFKMDYCLSYLSQFMTLLPGDVVTTGTPPGVGDSMKPPKYLKEGDVVTLKIDHLGDQKHNVVRFN
jgi:2-keto-4-pentenoate hydratase/2-oxohepta-3-ene-1,7-dioic acid hydratase in catechol pathway